MTSISLMFGNIDVIIRYENIRSNRELNAALVDNALVWLKCYKKFGKIKYKEMVEEVFTLSKKFKV